MSAKRRFATVIVAAATATSVATASATASEGSSKVLDAANNAFDNATLNLLGALGSSNDKLIGSTLLSGSTTGSLSGSLSGSLTESGALMSANQRIFGDSHEKATELSRKIGASAGLLLPLIIISGIITGSAQLAKHYGLIR